MTTKQLLTIITLLSYAPVYLLVWKELWDKDNDSKEAKNARKKWSQCVTEFGKIVSEEVRTNPRYKGIQK